MNTIRKMTPDEIKRELKRARGHIEAIPFIQKEAVDMAMAVLEADLWARYWTLRRDKLLKTNPEESIIDESK